MWFKQATIYQFSRPLSINQDKLSDALMPLSFSPCLPSLPASLGWVSPIENSTQLVYGSKRFWMICLQFEEKILPSSVVRQKVIEKILEIEKKESRIVRGKEKQSLKDEMTQTLLPKAFTKKTRVYGLIDLERQRLIINSNHAAKVERFVAFLKRAIAPLDLKSPDIKKPAFVMTDWLKKTAPTDFVIGQSGVLQDPQQQRRTIRCQQQDLSSPHLQSFLEEGCEITQLALSWKDQIHFVLTGDFSLRSMQFQEAVLSLSKSDYTETPEQRFDADFVIMTEIVTQLIDDLMEEFADTTQSIESVAA